MSAEQFATSITMYLAKESVKIEDCFAARRFQQFNVNLTGADFAVLAISQPTPTPPAWRAFVEAACNRQLSGLTNQSAAAILAIHLDGRIFLLTFGIAHIYVNEPVIERNFGLRVALNAIDRSKISTVDSQNLDLNGIQSRFQATTTTAIEEFDLDVEGSLIRAVTGYPAESTVIKKLTGRDGLRLSVRLPVSDLIPMLRGLLQLSASKKYREHFDWIDNLGQERDPSRIEALNEQLVSALNKRELGSIWLALPEIVEWTDIEGFIYGRRSKEIELDLYIEKYLTRGPKEGISLATLTNSKVDVINSQTGRASKRWSIYNCLYAEVTMGGDGHFLLSNGEWYQVKNDYYGELKEFMKALKYVDGLLPECAAGMKEDEYNKSVQESDPDNLVLGDKKLISCAQRAGGIEFCDLYSRRRRIIHVKKYGQSKVLGHLFNQANVSSELLISDGDFRRKVNELVRRRRGDVTFADSFSPSDFTVVLAVISGDTSRTLSLPLFSQIALRVAHRHIRAMRYKVALAKVYQPHFSRVL